MDIGTVAGLALGLTSLMVAFSFEGGSIASLFAPTALMIIFGGTLATVLICNPMSRVTNWVNYISIAFSEKHYPHKELIASLTGFAETARREGVLSLEQKLDTVSNAFLRKGITLVVDGNDPDAISDILTMELDAMRERHKAGATVFQKMGGYSPTMGIIGTVLGLISVLSKAGGDPNELIHGIGTAFLATLWGVLLANIAWLPIADKLKAKHEEEEHYMKLVIEGILAIQEGNHPSLLKQKLLSMLPASDQELEQGGRGSEGARQVA